MSGYAEEEPGISEPPAVDPEQIGLFGDEYASWYAEWQGMPEFLQEDLSPTKSVIVHFETLADLKAFSELVGQKITPNTQSIWYPEAEIGTYADKRYADEP